MALTMVDFFAGIGGIRLGFEQSGVRCVGTCEFEKYCKITYKTFFGEEPEWSDVNDIDPTILPEFDIFAAGFPCQSFSLAGISKRNDMGRPSGFEDETRGTLFFNIAEILAATKPKAIFLENVKNLVHHDKGKTFDVISRTLDELGYDITHKVIDSSSRVPQHRERIYIVGFRRDLGLADRLPEVFSFSPHACVSLADILEEDPGDGYNLSEKAWLGLQEHKRRHEAKGHGFGYGLIEPPFDGKITKTLLARYYKDGSEILISRGPDKTPRRLTPLECLRLQGFPKELERFFDGTEPMPISKTQAYMQFGNSVSVPVIAAIASNVIGILESVAEIAA